VLVREAYLNKRFKDQLNTKAAKGVVVTPLVSMNISCLERMMWVLHFLSQNFDLF
jgi:hypothetical protein